MSKHPAAVPSIAAALASALTIGSWTSIAPASASPTAVRVVAKVRFFDVIGTVVTANPDDLADQVEGVLRGEPEPDEGDVRMLPRGYGPDPL